MPLFVIALVIALTGAAGAGAAVASQDALPGDALYPVKTALERVQVSIAATEEAKAEAHLGLAAKRFAEVEKATKAGRPDVAAQAGEGLQRQITDAADSVDQAAASGKDVSSLVARLQENLQRLRERLGDVRDRAPDAAEATLTRVAESAGRGLEVAQESVQKTAAAGSTTGAPSASGSASSLKAQPATPANPAEPAQRAEPPETGRAGELGPQHAQRAEPAHPAAPASPAQPPERGRR